VPQSSVFTCPRTFASSPQKANTFLFSGLSSNIASPEGFVLNTYPKQPSLILLWLLLNPCHSKSSIFIPAWWHMPVIPALWRLRREDCWL
jgi:hypothetical protein